MIESKTYPKFKAAAVQAASVYLDLNGSVEKARQLIKEAADNGAKLIVFPEGFLPGFAPWVYMVSVDEGSKLYQQMQANAVEIPSPAIQAIAQAARDNDIYVVMSINELDRGSLYVTQVFFDDQGNMLGKHRKIRQSCAERIVYGEGDGSTMNVFKTPIGNIGGLECWEHLTPVNLTAMSALGEQIHCASWPSFYPGEGIMGPLSGTLGCQYYAIATQSYVVAASALYTAEQLKIYGVDKSDPDTYQQLVEFGGGISRIISPEGVIISDTLASNEEGIVYADIDLANIVPIKYWIDPAGHYGSKVVRILFNRDPLPPVDIKGEGADDAISFEELQQLQNNS